MAQAATPSYLAFGKARATPLGLWLRSAVRRAVMLREEGNRQGQWAPLCGRSHGQPGTSSQLPSLWHHPSLDEKAEAQRADRQKLAECDFSNKCWSWAQLRAPPRHIWPLGYNGWLVSGGGWGQWRQDGGPPALLCASHLSSSALGTVLVGTALSCPFNRCGNQGL